MDWLKRIRAVCEKARALSVRPLPSSLPLLLRRNKGFRGAKWEGRKGISVGGLIRTEDISGQRCELTEWIRTDGGRATVKSLKRVLECSESV